MAFTNAFASTPPNSAASPLPRNGAARAVGCATSRLLPYQPNRENADGRVAFSRFAEPLTQWAQRLLVNRWDAWGRYHEAGGQWTCRGELNHSVLVRHFQARSASDIIGLHTANGENWSKGGGIDIDQHGDDPAKAQINQAAALHWHRCLVRLGFCPVLYSSNDKGGYHLRLLLREPVVAERVFWFLRWLTSDYLHFGLARPPEQFPKQPNVRRCCKRMGNWLRLPGRHHKKEFWSEIWDGRSWLAGESAVALLLSIAGDPPRLLPDAPSRVMPAVAPARNSMVLQRAPLAWRIKKYLSRLPNVREGEGRDDVAYRFACFLVRDLARSDHEALDWLDLWDMGNRPPKGRARLQVILTNARTYGQRPIGCGMVD